VGLNAERKAEIVRAIFEEGWNRAEFDSFAPYLADEILFHWRGQELKTNLAELRRLVDAWRASFPDLHFNVVDVIVDGSRAAVNLVFMGTQMGAWRELHPSGRRARVEEMMFFRFEDGRVVELWEVFDEWELRRQLEAAEIRG
jgi:steroid delta-isomerase-like uncharacterized protein